MFHLPRARTRVYSELLHHVRLIVWQAIFVLSRGLFHRNANCLNQVLGLASDSPKPVDGQLLMLRFRR
jgi:hypothetical protein